MYSISTVRNILEYITSGTFRMIGISFTGIDYNFLNFPFQRILIESHFVIIQNIMKWF